MVRGTTSVYCSRRRTPGSLNTAVLALISSFLLVACDSGSDTSAGGSTGPDTTAPLLSITAPTTGGDYPTTSASVTVSVTATDAVGLSQIAWSNSTGGSGSASVSGTSSSHSFIVALTSGDNIITLTTQDTSGNSSQRQLTVIYTPAASNSATLTWDAAIAANLSGYRVYVGTAPGIYSQPKGQGTSVGNVTTYTMTGLSNGTRYYFAVTAFDTSANESDYSNEAFKDIP